MILLEGPNLELRAQLRTHLTHQLNALLGDQLTVNISGTSGLGTTAAVVRLLNTQYLAELRDGLPLDFAVGHPVYHMAGYALAATGSILVLAHNKPPYPRPMSYLSYLGRYLPTVHVYAEDDPLCQADNIIRVWRQYVERATARFRFGGSGPLETGNIMVVGERVNPFRPLSFPPWLLAFTSNQGCSFFLHAALEAAGGAYYLTNAVKVKNQRFNKELLRDEIAVVKPARIIAMGSEAARTLADLHVDYTKTYHPQYWKRFKNKDVGELVELLRPH